MPGKRSRNSNQERGVEVSKPNAADPNTVRCRAGQGEHVKQRRIAKPSYPLIPDELIPELRSWIDSASVVELYAALESGVWRCPRTICPKTYCSLTKDLSEAVRTRAINLVYHMDGSRCEICVAYQLARGSNPASCTTPQVLILRSDGKRLWTELFK